MPTYTYTLEKGGPKLVEISWRGFFCKNVSVSFDGQLLGIIETRKDVKQGRHFKMPNGSDIFVRLVNSMTATELHVLLDGKPLPGSGSDPEHQLKSCANVLYTFAAVTMIFGLVMTMNKQVITSMVTIGIAALFALLAWLVSKRSVAALIIAIALVIINAALLVYVPLSSGGSLRTGWLIFYILMLIPLFKGFPAISQLRRDEADKPFDQI